MIFIRPGSLFFGNIRETVFILLPPPFFYLTGQLVDLFFGSLTSLNGLFVGQVIEHTLDSKRAQLNPPLAGVCNSGFLLSIVIRDFNTHFSTETLN